MREEPKPDEPQDDVEDLDLPTDEGEDVKGGITDGTSNTIFKSCSTGKHFPTADINF